MALIFYFNIWSKKNSVAQSPYPVQSPNTAGQQDACVASHGWRHALTCPVWQTRHTELMQPVHRLRRCSVRRRRCRAPTWTHQPVPTVWCSSALSSPRTYRLSEDQCARARRAWTRCRLALRVFRAWPKNFTVCQGPFENCSPATAVRRLLQQLTPTSLQDLRSFY